MSLLLMVIGEYVRGQAHTNGIESFWSTLKRGYDGVYHHMSLKHLGRYVGEFAGRYNDRPSDTMEQMRETSLEGWNIGGLRYVDLTANEGKEYGEVRGHGGDNHPDSTGIYIESVAITFSAIKIAGDYH